MRMAADAKWCNASGRSTTSGRRSWILRSLLLRQRAGRNTGTTDHLQRHASDKQFAVRKEAATEVTSEEMKAIVESAEHTHQRCGLFYSETEMLRRVEDERRVENSETKRGKDLNKEQRGGSLRSLGEAACEKFHPVLLVARRDR